MTGQRVVTIRAAEPTDAQALADVFACAGVVAQTLQLPFRSVEEQRERLHAKPGRHALVGVVEGRVVGMLGLDVDANPRRRHCARLGMAVHDAYRGQGVGRALLAAAIELAEGWLGVWRLELQVYADNAPATGLYRRFGFEVEGRARHYALRTGEYVDALFMARVRPPAGWTAGAPEAMLEGP